MMNWWIKGQRLRGPNGEEIIRVSNVLYLTRREDEGLHYELIITRDESNYGRGFDHGMFHFEDYCTGQKGTLFCTEADARVGFDDETPTQWAVTQPAGEFAYVRLMEFDHRQVPAMLYQISNHAQYVYFSDWIHAASDSGVPLSVSRMFIVDFHDGTRQTITEVADIRPAAYEERNIFNVSTPNLDSLYLSFPFKPGDGYWGENRLYRRSLEDYTIVHDAETGMLMSITPKRA